MGEVADIELTRTAASHAVADIGWRYLVCDLATTVEVASLADAVVVAQTVVDVCGADAEDHLRLDLRPDRVLLSLQDRPRLLVTERDTALAQQITAALSPLGWRTGGATRDDHARPVQQLELAIDTMDMARIRPFWKAVLAYQDEPGAAPNTLIDPAGQGAALWFQDMDVMRPDRNRIHFDITVAHDEVPLRIAAALAAGGVMLTSQYAPAFWVLADPEGNEICICAWTGRDERGW